MNEFKVMFWIIAATAFFGVGFVVIIDLLREILEALSKR